MVVTTWGPNNVRSPGQTYSDKEFRAIFDTPNPLKFKRKK